jgi:capsular polysaccharide biosynthesis protein
MFRRHGVFPYWTKIEYQRNDGSMQYENYPWTGQDDKRSIWQRDGLIKTRERFSKIVERDESFPKKIYISRSDATRKWLSRPHDKEIFMRAFTEEPKLKEYFLSKGYTEVIMSDHSYKDQLKFFYNATHIVGLCGTGLVNSFICQEGTQVVEILANGKYQFSYRYMTQIAPIKFETIELRPDPKITAKIDEKAIEKLERYNGIY